ncbi:hypothetical protein LTR28_006280 [Elasticomyces elasticus]|nr:hypothetical protein LTR28_006280 [Elasticomyces elasticus]
MDVVVAMETMEGDEDAATEDVATEEEPVALEATCEDATTIANTIATIYPLHAHQQPYHPHPPLNTHQQQQQYQTPAPYPLPPLHHPIGYPPYSASQGSPFTRPIHPYQYSRVPAPTPDNNFPPGALVNPAFFNNSQNQQTQWPPHQPNSGWAAPPQPQTQWTPPQQYQQPVAGRWNAPQERQYGHHGGVQQSPQASNAFRAAQQQLDILRRLSSGSP